MGLPVTGLPDMGMPRKPKPVVLGPLSGRDPFSHYSSAYSSASGEACRAVQFQSFGEPAEVLKCLQIPEASPQHGEVRVRMLASPINPSDLMTIRGVYGQKPSLPAVPGYEGVGIVESGGGLFGRFLRGKRVAVLNRTGGNWAEFAVLPAKQCIPLPATLAVEQAAMFFVNPVTAYVMTQRVLKVPKGAWLLQSAAGSSLGQMVIRLGQHYGFRTLNVVRRPEQIDQLKALGADAVLTFDAQQDDPAEFARRVQNLTGTETVRYALDPVGGATATALLGCLRNSGRLLLFGSLSGEALQVSSRDLLTETNRIDGFWLARWMNRRSLPNRLSLVRKVSQLMQQGVLVNDVGRCYSLEEIKDAVQESEKPGRRGKTWLKIAES